MVPSQTTRFVPLLLSVASVLLGSVQSNPSPQSIPSTSRAPPPLPQYYPSSSQRPPSTASSSLSPTAPLYTAQRIRPSNGYEDDDEEPYPASAHLGTARTTSGAEDQPENTGFVEAIDFSSLLKDVGSSPKGPGLDIGASSSNPLFASESKDTFNGFFGSSKNPFEELTRLNTASSDHNSRQSNDDENSGFVDPNVQFRSLFDSTGTSGGFKPQDFLGSKSENIGSDPSKGSQTRAYPSFTYSGRKNVEREDDDYRGGREDGPSNRYRSSYRQVGNNNNDYYNRDAGPGPVRQYDDDRISNSPPTDSYDDEGPSSGPSYYNNGPSGPSPRGGGGGPGPRDNRDYDRATPRYSQAAQETSHAPKTQPRAAESKNPKCKKVEKSVEYSDDYSSFTEPESDYDPSTYQGRYKRQARQGGRGKAAGGKRPMTCYVCEDEQGRYAEKCSYDSNGSPKNGEYFHSESSSFSDNGNKRRPNSGGSSSKDRTRRNPNRQRSGGDIASAESTTKSVSTKPEDAPEIAESEPKVIDKRQSGGGDFGGGGDDNDDFGGNNNDRGNNPQRDEFGDPFDSRTGRYQNPSGYEGPPLGATGGRGGESGGRGGGGGGGGDAGFERDFNYQIPDYEREAASATREFDFSIPREFDPDVQLRGGGNNNNRGGSGGRGGGGGGGRASTGENPHSFLSGGRSGENPHSFLGGGRSGDSPHSFLGGGGQNRRSGGGGPHQSASNRRENLDAFDVGYSDYLRQNFPESLNSPGFTTENFPSSSNFGPSNYEYSPNYYHRPRGGGDGGGNDDRDERRQGAEISNSPSNHHNNRGYHGGRGGDRGGGGGRGGFGSGGDRGGFVPDKEHTQPSHNFAPPPGFFSEDSPAAHPHENYENLGNYMKEFSSKTRDGCHKVNKGDMTCYVCKDARGMNKEECMYASNDPKNKAMAYHEVTEYSSPTASILPAPLHATLLGLVKPSTEEDGTKEGSLAAASSNLFSLIPEESQVSSTVTPASTGKAKKTTPSNNNDKKKDVRSVKATRYAHSSTVIVHERSKRSPKEEEYDFDY